MNEWFVNISGELHKSLTKITTKKKNLSQTNKIKNFPIFVLLKKSIWILVQYYSSCECHYLNLLFNAVLWRSKVKYLIILRQHSSFCSDKRVIIFVIKWKQKHFLFWLSEITSTIHAEMASWQYQQLIKDENVRWHTEMAWYL